MLGGVKYLGASTALSIISVSSALFIVQNILTQAVAATRRTRYFIYSSAVSLLLNIGISFILIPRFGLTGAAVGFSSVYATSFIILFVVAKREGLVSFDVSGMTKVWSSAILMFSFVISVEYFTGGTLFMLPLYISLGVIVYFSLARLLHIFEHENREVILSIFPQNMRKIRRIVSFLVSS